MKVSETSARNMMKAIGFTLVDSWNYRELTKNINDLDLVVKEAKTPENPEDLALFQSVSEALREGEEIEIDDELPEVDPYEQEKNSEVEGGKVIPPSEVANGPVTERKKKVTKTAEKPKEKATKVKETKSKPDKPKKVEKATKEEKPKKVTATKVKEAKTKPDKIEKPKKEKVVKGKESSNGEDTSLRDKRGPGVVQAIVDFLKKSTKTKPATKRMIHAHLVEKFPERDEKSMKGTIHRQMGGHIKKNYDLDIQKNEYGYWID